MALQSVPFRTPMLTGLRELITRDWVRYLQSAIDIINKCAREMDVVSKEAQTASLSTTSFNTGTLDPGVYRVSYNARIAVAAGTSSSLTVTMTWTDGGVTQTQAGAAITGNSTTTQQNNTMLIHIDKATDIKYATTYSTSGAPAMKYNVYLLVEKIG